MSVGYQCITFMSTYNRKSLEVCYKDTILNAIVMKSWTSNLSNKETQGLTALDWENLSIFCLTYTPKKREKQLRDDSVS